MMIVIDFSLSFGLILILTLSYWHLAKIGNMYKFSISGFFYFFIFTQGLTRRCVRVRLEQISYIYLPLVCLQMVSIVTIH